MKRGWISFGIALAVVLICCPASATTLRLLGNGTDEGILKVRPGETFTIVAYVEDVENLAAFGLMLIDLNPSSNSPLSEAFDKHGVVMARPGDWLPPCFCFWGCPMLAVMPPPEPPPGTQRSHVLLQCTPPADAWGSPELPEGGISFTGDLAIYTFKVRDDAQPGQETTVSFHDPVLADPWASAIPSELGDPLVVRVVSGLPADANGDCVVNILDLIFIRNRLNQDVSTGDNWQADANEDGEVNILDMIFVRNHIGEKCGEPQGDEPAPGLFILEGPDDRGESPLPEVPDWATTCKVTVDVYGQGFFGFGRVQTALRFIHPENGECEFALEDVVHNEAAFPDLVGIFDPDNGIAGFVLSSGDVDLEEKTWLYSLAYAYTDECTYGDYTVDADPERTAVGSPSGGEMHFNVVSGSSAIRPKTGRYDYPPHWPIPGDANGDCKVTILDLICVRNNLNLDCWNPSPDGVVMCYIPRMDVNHDLRVNILDMIFVRNRLNTMCDCE